MAFNYTKLKGKEYRILNKLYIRNKRSRTIYLQYLDKATGWVTHYTVSKGWTVESSETIETVFHDSQNLGSASYLLFKVTARTGLSEKIWEITDAIVFSGKRWDITAPEYANDLEPRIWWFRATLKQDQSDEEVIP